MPTILPNDRASFLPVVPVDKQEFVDSDKTKWVYSADGDHWVRVGTVDTIPLASDSVNGFLSPQDKILLDKIPAAGGAFGIIVDHGKLLLQTPENPEGVVQGDIKLVSESLDIECVTNEQVPLECGGTQLAFSCESGEEDEGRPGIKFSISDKFLETMVVEFPAPPGKRGDRGDQGPEGDPGFSDGPKGETGEVGENVTDRCEFLGFLYEELEGITDTAVVRMEIVNDTNGNCKLVMTKAKLNVPDNSKAADQVVAAPLTRSVVFPDDPNALVCDVTRLDNWTLAQPAGDTSTLDVQLVRLAKGSNESESEPVSVNNTMPLSTFVDDVVDYYKDKLVKLDNDYAKEVKNYIESIDDRARGILSGLADELSRCEFALPAVEFCTTFVACDQPFICGDAGAAVSSTATTQTQEQTNTVQTTNSAEVTSTTDSIANITMIPGTPSKNDTDDAVIRTWSESDLNQINPPGGPIQFHFNTNFPLLNIPDETVKSVRVETQMSFTGFSSQKAYAIISVVSPGGGGTVKSAAKYFPLQPADNGSKTGQDDTRTYVIDLPIKDASDPSWGLPTTAEPTSDDIWEYFNVNTFVSIYLDLTALPGARFKYVKNSTKLKVVWE